MSEGKNVERDAALSKLADSVKSLLIICLEGLVEGSQVKYEKGGIFKVHVSELDSDGILGLAVFAKQKFVKINIKRSGTGITIIVRLEKPEEGQPKPELKVV